MSALDNVLHKNITNQTQNRNRLLSRDWFNDFDQLKHILQPQADETGAGYERVKIAVLDTGINAKDYQSWVELAEVTECPTIAEYKDFVIRQPGVAACDETGHGSIAVTLLIKMCPNALLYPARVLSRNVATSADVQNIVDVQTPNPMPFYFCKQDS